MTAQNLKSLINIARFHASRSRQSQMCVDFTNELESSLNLFKIGFLAKYFPQLMAGTAALIIYVTFIKPARYSKKFVGLISVVLTYFIVEWLATYLVNNILSYCVD